ncbi:MAG TPA: Ig-like domain-containing protein [Anaerolineales bacterium]|nr:Ig-like domain-containing protein [Anaerolineales bacterium]
MTSRRISLLLNCLLSVTLILSSCTSLPELATPTSPIPTSTSFQQSLPPALVETDPPPGSVLGHLSPLTFYFNQVMDKASVESALSGLPEGTFTWSENATLLFTPAQPYPPDTKLNITIADSLRSANGIGIDEPIELSFTVADFLRATNFLPEDSAADVNVEAAVAVSFNQPVVALGSDPSAQPPAFSIQPSVAGRGEWINTSTYIFYPEPSMPGGTEYTVSLDQDLKTVTGVGLAPSGAEGSDAGGQSAWTFTTSRPRVVTLEPSNEQPLPLDPEIRLTFNQPMDTESVESNFSFNGNEGRLDGDFSWNEDETEVTFVPEDPLGRDVGYILNVGAQAESQGGMTLGIEYGVVLTTYDDFAITATQPDLGVTTFTFSAPLARDDYDNAVTVFPEVDNFDTEVSEDGLNLYVRGDFTPDTDYQIELSTSIKDRWGASFGEEPFVLGIRTPPLPSTLNVRLYGSTTTFVRPDEPVLYADATNIQSADITVAPLPLQDFVSLQNSYEDQQAYLPDNSITFSQMFDLPPGAFNEVTIDLAQDDNQLLPGLYYVNVSSPQIQADSKIIYFVASSQVNLTFKLGATEALVWAIDLSSQSPVANAPVTIYDDLGNELASGRTDEDGLWKGAVGERNGQAYAVLGQPGDENFALAVNGWGLGINAWDFGYSQWVRPPHTEIYMYTDRPIYRPGQKVYFRGIARQAFNGRYELPSIHTVPLVLRDPNGVELTNLELQLSPYGTFNGEFDLPQDAVPGYYLFENGALDLYFSFQVAEYRKPEIDLSVDFAADEIELGDTPQANVNARYFFDAPAGDVEVRWALYAKPDTFHLPNYQTGLLDTGWLDVFHTPGFSSDYLGNLIREGMGRTTPEGLLSIELPAIPEAEAGQLVTLEVTAQDESGLPVSARAELRVHPADFYIGLLPDQWIGRADSPIGFEVYTVDWARNPSVDHPLSAEFKQVRWEKETDSFGFPTYRPIYTPVSSSDLITGTDGKARLSFIPPRAGTYMLDVSGEGARTQTLVWVGGAGSAAWPELPNQRLELTADRETYQAGDTAKIFIPNPFAVKALALVTVERGLVSSAEVIRLSGSGREYSLPLTEDDGPNVYVSVTLLGEGNDFRHGLVNLPVAPDAQALNVQVTSNPPEAGPREDVTFDVFVTDHQAQPVEGEFSLSVVDLATLALADPNAEDILPAFYSIQPLGIETGISLAAYSGRDALQPGGGGGGGGDFPPFVREEFPDTAYWNPSLVTNSEGRGQVTMTLPDSLTTWQVDVRGLTVDTRVGQAETRIVATKPLLIRPVTPRFLVRGDHVLMAAVVNNNTSDELNVSVNLQGEGFVLDEPGQAAQQAVVPANGRARVEWWGTAGPAESADLIFAASTTGTASLQDSARPAWGELPILQYTSPQTFVTGGVLRGAASQQEVISLPRTFTPHGGGLDVELSPSLAGSLLSALEVMEIPDYAQSAEALISYLLPNIEVYRALNNAGLSDPALTERVTSNIAVSVSRLLSLQNFDGGWSWWGRSPVDGGTGGETDPYISAYVFFGLLRARAVGMAVNEDALQRAGTYLSGLKLAITNDTNGARLDEIAFIQFVLAQANTFDEETIDALYESRDRLSPSGKALLAFVLDDINPADARVRDLISNLETSAVITSSGAHWETLDENIVTRGSPIYTTSIVVYILAQIDSANQVVFNAVRYLAAHRDVTGLWASGHDNAWAMLALNEAMIGFGDLNPDFTFGATLNGGPVTTGEISGNQVLTPQKAQVPLEYLSPNSPNLLTITRGDGLGRLYYRTALQVNRRVEDVRPLDAGMRIERVYCESALSGASPETKRCLPISNLDLSTNKVITAQLTLVLPHDSYYVMVEDFIPAGTEILNRSLKTSQQALDSPEVEVQDVRFDEENPFAGGWGWWLFHEPQVRDDGILFSADYLPAGTYVLTYTIIPLQAGEYRVLPAHAWESFFPEVQGTSAGTVFEIKP